MRRFAFLGLALVLGLSMLGVASAAWGTQASISGTASTGSLEVSVSASSSDSSVLAQVVGTTVTVTIGSAKANASYSFYLTVQNTGSIPSKVGIPINKTETSPLLVDAGISSPVPLYGSDSATFTVTISVPQNAQAGDYSFSFEVPVGQVNG